LARLPEEARDKVLTCDLKALGMNDVPPLVLGGFAKKPQGDPNPLPELFLDGQPMPWSRWPNYGFVSVADVSDSDPQNLHGLTGSKAGEIFYSGDRPKRWLEEPDAYLYGYWFFGWADSYEKIAAIDTNSRKISFHPPFAHYGYRKNAPYFAVNLLSEIDSPGEWYLDRENALLYFYPPKDLSQSVVELSFFKEPFLRLTDVAYVSFEGITWEMGCVDAIHVNAGEHCAFLGCEIRNFAANGILINGGTHHLICSCNVSSMGRAGLIVHGGDRKTLTPGNHVVENCHMHHLARINHTYNPAVLLIGVGNKIAHNLVHDIPSSAFRISGNDHIIEYNRVHHVVLESDDQGGVDMWGNPTYRGNVFRFNWWHDIGNQVNPTEAPDCGHAGIRFDDAISGQYVHANVFERASAGRAGFGGVQIHGGKDNTINNCVFLECMVGISFIPWGEKRWKEFVAGKMDSADIDRDLYLERYPELKQLEENHDTNKVTNNLVINCGKFLFRDSERIYQENNVELKEKLSLPMETTKRWKYINYLLKEHGLEPIPFENIGLYRCHYRKSVPL